MIVMGPEDLMAPSPLMAPMSLMAPMALLALLATALIVGCSPGLKCDSRKCVRPLLNWKSLLVFPLSSHVKPSELVCLLRWFSESPEGPEPRCLGRGARSTLRRISEKAIEIEVAKQQEENGTLGDENTIVCIYETPLTRNKRRP
jgi:hypothetical protein